MTEKPLRHFLNMATKQKLDERQIWQQVTSYWQ